MAKIKYGTHYISEDEPCLGIREFNKRPFADRPYHRYQEITVVRDDKAAEFIRDLGLARNFKGDLIWIIGGLIGEKIWMPYPPHTVGELCAMAERDREASLFDKRELVGLNKIRT